MAFHILSSILYKIPLEALFTSVHRSVYLHVSKAFRPVLYEEFFHEVLRDGIHVPWPVDFPGEYFLVNAERIVVEKGRIAGEHFINQDAY